MVKKWVQMDELKLRYGSLGICWKINTLLDYMAQRVYFRESIAYDPYLGTTWDFTE